MVHNESHPQRRQTVKVKFKGGHPQSGQRFLPDGNGDPDQVFDYVVEDWWDKLTGGSWMNAEGNPACMLYGMRSGFNQLPIDNEVVYGHIGTFGHLVHVSEIQS